MEYEVVSQDEFVLCGITARVSNREPAKIGALWQQFYSEPFVDTLEIEDGAVFSAYFDYEGDHADAYTVLVGFRVAGSQVVPAGLSLLKVDAAKYARLRRSGAMPATVVEAWKEIWNSDLRRTFVADFDRYHGADRVEVNVGIE